MLAIRRSRVTIELAPHGSGTALVLVHEDLPDTPDGRAHSIGWEDTLANLDASLA